MIPSPSSSATAQLRHIHWPERQTASDPHHKTYAIIIIIAVVIIIIAMVINSEPGPACMPSASSSKEGAEDHCRPVRRSTVRILKMRNRLCDCDCSHNPINAAGLLGNIALILLLAQW